MLLRQHPQQWEMSHSAQTLTLRQLKKIIMTLALLISCSAKTINKWVGETHQLRTQQLAEKHNLTRPMNATAGGAGLSSITD